MKRIRRWLAAALSAMAVLSVAGCGQKMIAGPLPAEGDLVLRVAWWTDGTLPVLPAEELDRALRRSEAHLQAVLSRKVRLDAPRPGDLQAEFDALVKPFGRLRFAYRLDPRQPLPEDQQRLVYARIMDLLRSEKFRPMLPSFSMDENSPDVRAILDTGTTQFGRAVDQLREKTPFWAGPYAADAVRDRRSVFAWSVVLGTVPVNGKPADLILTNDLLIFDSLTSLPPTALVTGGVVTGYTRLYPGVSIVSTLPFLSGDLSREERVAGLAWAITREVGGKLILMNEEDFHPGCVNAFWIPPLSDTGETPGPCERKHTPLDRRGLRTAYLADFIRGTALRGRPADAVRALEELRRLSPGDPVVEELQAMLDSAGRGEAR